MVGFDILDVLLTILLNRITDWTKIVLRFALSVQAFCDISFSLSPCALWPRQELYSVVFPRNVTEFSYRYHKSSRADMMVSFQALEGTSRYAALLSLL